jgi:dienelactone hydrolase
MLTTFAMRHFLLQLRLQGSIVQGLLGILLTGFILLLASPYVLAQPALPEEVVMIKKPGLVTLELEVTLFKPPGSGPFPLVVINHGKATGDPRFQGRATFRSAARYFLSRGYVVALPMRQGFSKSSGSYIGGGCNVESNGVAQAEDVAATLDYLTSQPIIDKSRILVMGQSHGGLTTMALGASAYPGVVGLVNFAGGLRQETCAGWESVLARAFGSYGKRTKIPSLWFYGDNDSYWSKETWKAMHSNYLEAVSANGTTARMVAFGNFVTDAHSMFSHPQGLAIWEPELSKFLDQLALPNTMTHPQFSRANTRAPPPASGFAALTQIDAVPFLKDTGRKGYERFIAGAAPRAFALSPSGAWGFSVANDESLERALATCNKNAAKQDCRLYAVDDEVVWTKD